MALTRKKALRDGMNDDLAAEIIQAWYVGNYSREQLEESRIERNVSRGMDGASIYKQSSSLRRRLTVIKVGQTIIQLTSPCLP